MIDFPFPSNPVLDRLPRHLLQFVKPQHYEGYSPVDQAVWRYVMRKNVQYLQHVAHESYLEGLKQTGISMDAIPSMYGMNRILKKIGWAAVAVDGLIPTEAFLEFQAYNVLVIASDIRTLEDIEYTPVPDIIHESAGHAPIIANPEYAEFLRRMGQIGARAITSSNDKKLHQLVRELTTLKESRGASPDQIRQAEDRVVEMQEQMGEPSEMSSIRNLHWWSVEYGLIGTPDAFRIYGAGLLSSIGESKWCMSDKVAKLPYSLETAQQNFDYTKPQPQLYVTPDFAHLSYVLEEYANTMAIRQGGLSAVHKLIDSGDLGTIELNTGIQISGIFDRVVPFRHDQVAYVATKGPTALAYREKELVGHGTLDHPDGFGTPVGKLQRINLPIEDMSPTDLDAYDIYEGRKVKLTFEGGVIVEGEVITGIRNLQGKIILIRFRDCTVRLGSDVLFSPEQGIYDMAVGYRIVSGFASPADLDSFDLIHHQVDQVSATPPVLSPREQLYADIHQARKQSLQHGPLITMAGRYQEVCPDDWLLGLDLYELLIKSSAEDLADEVYLHLQKLQQSQPDIAHLIADGLELLDQQAPLPNDVP